MRSLELASFFDCFAGKCIVTFMHKKIVRYPVLLFVSVLFWRTTSLALGTNLPDGLSYEIRKDTNHVIHILKINPKHYHLKLVKAHNQVFGRETVFKRKTCNYDNA